MPPAVAQLVANRAIVGDLARRSPGPSAWAATLLADAPYPLRRTTTPAARHPPPAGLFLDVASHKRAPAAAMGSLPPRVQSARRARQSAAAPPSPAPYSPLTAALGRHPPCGPTPSHAPAAGTPRTIDQRPAAPAAAAPPNEHRERRKS